MKMPGPDVPFRWMPCFCLLTLLTACAAGQAPASPPPATKTPVMEFSDKPNFTVAGITDWTAAGGHGSDAVLRTSEDLTRQTLMLKDSAGTRPALNPAADAHRLAGEADERKGDPLGAVRELAQAVTLEPSEQNYFAWGSELLLHRAVWQAYEVFARGATLYPESQRMKTGCGAALFAGARYDEASQQLCMASDLDPRSRETYVFLGRLALGSPKPEACVQDKLARFARLFPDDYKADYFKAMVLLKAGSREDRAQAQALLQRAVTLNPRYADGFLQLGILALADHNQAGAQADFQQAIAADATLAEAHYRLAVLYDRAGHPELARPEFATHARLEKEQAEAVDRERRLVKQFLVAGRADQAR